MVAPDLLTIARSCIAASAATADPLVAAWYLASSRIALDKLAEDVRGLELLVAAREAAMARRGAPKEQLGLEESGK